MARLQDSTEELQQVMSELWDKIKADKAMSAEILKAQLIVRFDYKEAKGLNHNR